MSNDVVMKYSFQPTWNIVKEIKEKTSAIFKEHHRDLMDATVMTASELIENAVKYGMAVPGKDGKEGIHFELTANDQKIVIKIANAIVTESDFQNVKRHIDEIKVKDPAELYTQRLMQLLNNPKPGESQLGLYRIAYEGEYRLDYTYQNNLLTIIAERDLN